MKVNLITSKAFTEKNLTDLCREKTGKILIMPMKTKYCRISFLFAFILFLLSCQNNSPTSENKKDACSDPNCKTVSLMADSSKEKNKDLSCKLTAPELQKRKATVLADLQKQILQKKELPDGYSFKFKGSDKMIDELNEFIKTERACCDFFTFKLSITGDTSEVWLDLTGPKGVKEMIGSELEL